MYTVLKLAAAAAAGAGAAWALQQRRLEQARYDRTFGMLNRAGLDAYLARVRGACDVVFVDLDNVHALNDTLGPAELDRRVRLAFGGLRRSDSIAIGRWYSGDEIVILAALGDGPGLAQRLTQLLAEQQLGATIAIQSTGPVPAIAAAQRRVLLAKRAGDRGRILIGEA